VDAAHGDTNRGAAFDPDALTVTLRSGMFNRYMSFALEVEALPTDSLSTWSEMCDCHALKGCVAVSFRDAAWSCKSVVFKSTSEGCH